MDLDRATETRSNCQIHFFITDISTSYLIPGFMDPLMLLKIATGKIFSAIEVMLYFIRQPKNLRLKQ